MAEPLTRQAQANLASVLERLIIGVLVLDADSRVVLANSRARILLASPLAEGTSLGPLPGRAVAALRAALSGAAEGECVALPCSAGDLHDRAAAGVVARMQAVSGGWLVELFAGQSDPKAGEYVSNQTRLAVLARVATGIAHEVNNPLHPVLGYTELTKGYLEELYQRAVMGGGRFSLAGAGALGQGDWASERRRGCGAAYQDGYAASSGFGATGAEGAEYH